MQERVPLQYLVGASHWRDLVVAVGPGVLIPRPETEQIIDFVQEELQSSPNLAAAPWADLGCGSGVHAPQQCAATFRDVGLFGSPPPPIQVHCMVFCAPADGKCNKNCRFTASRALVLRMASCWRRCGCIFQCPLLSVTNYAGALACALAKLLSHVTGGLRQGAPPTVLACDISPVAVAYTELNARRLGVDTIVDVRQGSWGEPLQLLQGSLAGIVSNPPYIPPTLMSTLQEEVRRSDTVAQLLKSSCTCSSECVYMPPLCGAL